MIDIDKLPKHRRDWLEIWGNAWQPLKTDGVACDACVYGEKHGYPHSVGCPNLLGVEPARETARFQTEL